MIPSSAALPVVFGERPPVRRLGQRQGVGQEPPSARLLEGRPGYLVGSRLHLHRRPALITVTPPTGTATDIRVTHRRAMDSRAIHTQAILDIPPILALQVTDTQATRDTRPILALRVMDTKATWDILCTLALPATNIRAMQDTSLTSALQAMNTRATGHSRSSWFSGLRIIRRLSTPHLTLVPRATNIRAARLIHPRPVPVLDIPSMAIPAITPRRVGRLGPSSRSNLMAEHRLKFFRHS